MKRKRVLDSRRRLWLGVVRQIKQALAASAGSCTEALLSLVELRLVGMGGGGQAGKTCGFRRL